MNKQLVIAGISGAIVVILGALGAHALKSSISTDQLTSFKTGTTYHMYHTIMLVILALFPDKNDKLIKTIFGLFLGGIVLFSGSIYLLTTKDLIGISSWKWLGPITPFGGILFISGWLLLAYYAFRKNNY